MTCLLSKKDYLVTFVVVLVALGLSFAFTRSMTPSFDSVRYANVAHWIAEGEGVSTSLTVIPVQDSLSPDGDSLHAFTIQPPGLPLFYAVTGVANRMLSHRILHLVSYMGLAWLVLALGVKLSGRFYVGVTASLLTILSPVLLQAVSSVLADLSTLTLLLGALFCSIRSREDTPRNWLWLIAASVLAALAISLRLTALAFGAVLLADILLNRRLVWRVQLLRLLAGSGIFGGVALWILLRNKILAGSLFGTIAHDWPMAPQYSLLRGWSYLGSRLMHSLVPAWGTGGVSQKLNQVNSGPEVWTLPLLLLIALAVITAVMFVLQRKGHLGSWTPGGKTVTSGARTLAFTLFFASLFLLLMPAGRHAEFGVIEFRYLITLLPLLWIAIAALVISTGSRLINLGLGLLLIITFAIGVPGLYQPYEYSRDFMRPGLDWVKYNIPTGTAVLSNGGKTLLDEDLTRHVYHISTWNFRHSFPEEMRTEAGLLSYLRQRNIRYVVLFGQANRRRALFWGRPIIGLLMEQYWQPWLAYSDKFVRVYRIAPFGPLPDKP